jgi:hypothetical protein
LVICKISPKELDIGKVPKEVLLYVPNIAPLILSTLLGETNLIKSLVSLRVPSPVSNHVLSDPVTLKPFACNTDEKSLYAIEFDLASAEITGLPSILAQVKSS